MEKKIVYPDDLSDEEWDLIKDLVPKGKRGGIIKKIHDVLREQVRQQEGRKKAPTAMILDSQSVKTTDKRGAVVVLMPPRKSRVVKGIS